MPRTRTPLLVAVRDPPSVEVVRGELDLHAVARKDADVVAPHLPGDVPEDLVVVVELHAEHRVGEGLHDLALHLDLVFLSQGGVKTTSTPGANGGRAEGERAEGRRPGEAPSAPRTWPCPAPAPGSCRRRSGGPRSQTAGRRCRLSARRRRGRRGRGTRAPSAWSRR